MHLNMSVMWLKRAALDIAYGSAAIATSPYWVWRMHRTGKLRTDWSARFGRVQPALPPRGNATIERRPRVLLHGVSVGEVNAIRLLVTQLAAQAKPPEIIVAATTDTGFARAQSLFEPLHRVVRYPFDLSFAVGRFLDATRPDVVVMVELEVWPNLTALCAERGIRLVVVNGRLSSRSFPRYRRVRLFVAPSFARLGAVSAQTSEYAQRFVALGVPSAHVRVGGTMKWDTAEIADQVDGADALAAELGIDRTRPVVVAGSTAPGEELLIANALPAGAQLIVAPRKPEWFRDAAEALVGSVRRTSGQRKSPTDRYVLDTIGELRKAYALADVVVVGRSFGALHGSDMMEPVALGKATVVGPRSGDFRETMDALKAGGGVVETSAPQLATVLARLLASPGEREQLAERGRAVIRAHQGATRRNVELIMSMLAERHPGGTVHA
ncbi:MAG: glycosyltransferase N-terminal domain-containing protein [Phycisphaerae bacterium]|nr:glycosyltransferase N-terminal domain-containing protein [Phycisphaerae bacterium]